MDSRIADPLIDLIDSTLDSNLDSVCSVWLFFGQVQVYATLVIKRRTNDAAVCYLLPVLEGNAFTKTHFKKLRVESIAS